LILKILGCSGGIGSSLRTTSMLLGEDILIDAGTGVGDLSLDELAQINHIFLTHAHLDHLAAFPLLIDTVGRLRESPITLHALAETITALREHVFNWKIWPDFTQIPSAGAPALRFERFKVGDCIRLNGCKITALPANHVVPAAGFHIDSGNASLVYTGDTSSNGELWKRVNEISNLRYLIIECGFSNRDHELALAAKHLCPDLLARELARLERRADIFVTHLNPNEIELTMREVIETSHQHQPRMLENNQVFEL
jgi:cAMP phosphodiesterase